RIASYPLDLCPLIARHLETTTLFPYTTLFRSPVNSKKCDAGTRQRPAEKCRPSDRKLMIGAPLGLAGGNPQRNLANSFVPFSSRSEEHTSELQSLRHLVCRLLLEKKKLQAATD